VSNGVKERKGRKKLILRRQQLKLKRTQLKKSVDLNGKPQPTKTKERKNERTKERKGEQKRKKERTKERKVLKGK